jgi:hypothetical protein
LTDQLKLRTDYLKSLVHLRSGKQREEGIKFLEYCDGSNCKVILHASLRLSIIWMRGTVISYHIMIMFVGPERCK